MIHTTRAAVGLALLLLSGVSALANDAAVSFVGGTPTLVAEDSVRLVEEQLTFRYHAPAESPPPEGGRCDEDVPAGARWRGRCRPGWWCQEEDGLCRVGERWQAELTYVLRNEGETTRDLQVGLPFRMPWREAEHLGPGDGEPIEGFETLLDGQPAEVRRVDEEAGGEIPFNRLYVSAVTFEPGQTRTLTHRYLSHASVAAAEGEVEYHYLLETGRNWSGTIGRARIEFQLPSQAGPCVMSSLPAQRDGDWLRIDLTDWSADRDFEVIWTSRETVLMMAWEGDLPSFDVTAETAEDVCREALAAPDEEHERLAALVELLYGAPAEGSRAAASAEGPGVWCRATPSFGYLMDDPEAAARRGFDASSVRWQADPRFPDNMPPGLAACVAQLRRADAQPGTTPPPEPSSRPTAPSSP